nr:T9SS type A sorting domain-containing protein [Saprospiraceae bacterium]
EFSCADIGLQTVTITAEGSNGQSSTCQVEVEVFTDDDPELECVATATYDLDSNGEFTLDPNELITSVSISCGTVEVSANQIEFTCADLGINTVSVTAEGNNGNTNTCQVEVNIEDYNSPVLECVSNYTIELDEDGEAVLDANDLVTTAEAVCGEVELNLSHTNFDCGDIGNVIVIIGAEAENNQVSTCEVLVSVEDNNPPVIECEEELVIELEGGETKVLQPDDFIIHVEVVCGDFEILVSQTEFSCGDFGVKTVTIEVTGSNGLVSTCNVLVNVTYTEEFEIQCYEVGTLELDHKGEVSLNPLDLISSLPESCGEIEVEASQSEFTCEDIGDNSITITAANDFGQVSECMVSILVVDSIPPEINCRDVVVNLEEGGVFNLDISTAITGMSDNCDSLSLVTDSLLQLDCSHVGVNSVEIIISDQSGSLDTCITGLTVTDTMNFCDNLIIEGALVTEFGEPVGRAEVHLLKESNIFKEFEVQQDGEYRFEELVSGSDYLLIPEKDINLLNGVSTFDALLIQAHILGIRVLDSPYKLIAADVRPDGKIDVLDILDIRNLILGRRSTFPSNNSWKFIFSEQDFQPGMVHPPPPSQLETSREYMDLSRSVYDADFIGVKIGDVNNSVHPTSLVQAEERELGEAYSLEVENFKFEEDDLVKVELKAADFRQLLGFQYTFHFDLSSLEFVDFESGILPELSEDNFGFQLLEEGIITQSWNSLMDFYPREEEVLYTFIFKAKKEGQLKESVYLSSQVTPAEAYPNLFETMGMELIFSEKKMESHQTLYLHRNSPNPFSQSTYIEFSLTQKEEVEVVVFDRSGQKVKVVLGTYERGFHRIEITRADLNSGGIYFYQIKYGNAVETGKMSFVPLD